MEEEMAGGTTPRGPVDSEAQKGSPEDGVQQERGKWANKTEFLLSMAGEIIGLGNVWRFPYLCYKNGGGVFFIPYFVFLFFCGIPVFFLETALGQYTSEGGVTAWRKICPIKETMYITSPEEEFWARRVLRTSDNVSLGAVHWDLALCLLLAWIICYFCIWKGVVYFTATFPYLMLFILFIRGVTLPGAGEGLKYYLWPQMDKILEPGVWRDAGTQVFFSYAVCQGVLTSLGSYNKYNNDSFIAYPKAVSLLPGAQFWAVLFFLMVILLGLDSQFVCVESLATSITDMFPGVLRRPGRREILVLVIAVVCFLLGLPLITENGIVLFQLIDSYGPSGTSLLFIACFECIAVAWVYGANRFLDNIEDMIGYHPFPSITLAYDTLTSSSINLNLDYVPGPWASRVACLLILTPLMCIPVYILLCLWRNPTGMTTPSSDLRQARPHEPRLTVCDHVIIKGQQKPPRIAGEQDEMLAMEESSGV
ncbi:unnamed protein product [Coregonus sp. 'balchen']|nr:unnamed protein product [Coregonus sp. 'balchen']